MKTVNLDQYIFFTTIRKPNSGEGLATLEEMEKALNFYKAQYERLKAEANKLKRVVKAMRNAGIQLPPWAADLNLEPESTSSRMVNLESIRRLVYRAAVEAYRKYSRPIKPSEVRREMVKLSACMGLEAPKLATVSRMLKQLSSREIYGCDPPLISIGKEYLPKDASQGKLNTLESFIEDLIKEA